MAQTMTKPKTEKGTVNINMPIDIKLHSLMKSAASLDCMTLQDWVRSVIREKLNISEPPADLSA